MELPFQPDLRPLNRPLSGDPVVHASHSTDWGLHMQCKRGSVLGVARPKKLTHQLVVRVDEETYQRLAKAADRDGRQPTQLARHLIQRWLEENGY